MKTSNATNIDGVKRTKKSKVELADLYKRSLKSFLNLPEDLQAECASNFLIRKAIKKKSDFTMVVEIGDKGANKGDKNNTIFKIKVTLCDRK